MSFYKIIEEFKNFDFNGYFKKVTDEDIRKTLLKEKLSYKDFLNLLSTKAQDHLEIIANRAHKSTVQYFGRVINLFMPLYISNYCSNECIYCGFNKKNRILRKKLSFKEIEEECREIAKTQIRHILLLTGGDRAASPPEFIREAVKILKKYFSSISIEVYQMDENEYLMLKNAGVDGLTIYQEVYDEEIYSKVHLSGEKRDYLDRLDAPERGAKAGFRMVNTGALMGLGETRSEAFFCGMHAKYLDDKYLDTEISISLPRLREAEGGFKPNFCISDKSFVQFMLACRLFIPRAGLTVSTRESPELRDRLIYLGATRLSAGSRTGVGGYAGKKEENTPQFVISDNRSVDEIVSTLKAKGFQPVFKDWELF